MAFRKFHLTDDRENVAISFEEIEQWLSDVIGHIAMRLVPFDQIIICREIYLVATN